jgi:GntR family transcriptional regulator
LVARTQLAGNTGITRYLQLYTVLSQALADGKIVPGSALPSEPELVRKYQVSRTTVRRALARLEKESRIIRRRGSGTYARMVETRAPLRVRVDSFLADMRNIAAQTKAHLLDLKRVPTPEFVRRQCPEFGPSALYIRRTREWEGEPFLISTSYVPERYGRRLNRRQLGNKILLVALQEIGAQPARTERLISAIAADTESARHLKVAVGAPLVHARQVVRDPRGRMVEYSEICYRPERYEFRTESTLR